MDYREKNSRHPASHSNWLWLLVCALLLVPLPLRAEDSLVDQATNAFNNGDFPLAAQLLEDAYNQDPVPLYLFNIGRAYEEAHQWLEAKEYFEVFLRTEPSPPQRETAERHLAAVTARLPPPPQPLPPPPPPGPKRPVAPWLVAATGALCAGAGGTLLYLAHSRRETVRNAAQDNSGTVKGMSQARAFTLRGEADRLAVAGGALAGVGAAAIAGGAVWAVLTWDAEDSSSNLEVAPQASGFLVGWTVSF